MSAMQMFLQAVVLSALGAQIAQALHAVGAVTVSTQASSDARSRSGMSLTRSGRASLGYLVAKQQWLQATRKGMKCPPPEACECHCNCPDTVSEKPPALPPPCPMYLTMPTPPPLPTPAPIQATSSTQPALPPPPPPQPPVKEVTCVDGEVKRADGTCSKITQSVIAEFHALVLHYKTVLDLQEARMAKQRRPNCDFCPGTAKYFGLRTEVIDAHTEYRRALDLLLAILAMYKPDAAAAVDNATDVGPEFVLGKKALRVHCESWSKNLTMPNPSRDMCGIICRNEPTCKGFAMDPQYGWCIWFDKFVPATPETSCSKQTTTVYVKNRNHTFSSEVWVSIEKVHTFEKKLQQTLDLAELQDEIVNTTFSAWYAMANVTLKKELRTEFVSSKDNYTWTLQDAAELRGLVANASNEAYNATSVVADLDPPFEKTTTMAPLTTTTVAAPTLGAPPLTLAWKDFPNSDDSQWSAWHPDCPMGAPCFCDCQCRGSPAQNFVEPPPPPPMPCPLPPPTPNPLAAGPPMFR